MEVVGQKGVVGSASEAKRAQENESDEKPAKTSWLWF